MALIEQVRRFLLEAEKSKKSPLIVILGPTASGKTAFSLRLALELGAEVISADSRQIYREMDIGTDKVSTEIRKKIPHHLIDIRDPDETYNLSGFQRDAKRCIEDLHRRGKVPLLVGGTGLYISSIVQDYQLPEAQPDLNLRQELETELEREGAEALHDMLQELDSLSASKIHPRNHRYLIRALEINLATKRPVRAGKGKCPYEVLQVGIDWPTETLFARVNHRVDQQMEHGLLEETQRLLKKYDKALPSMSGLGYKQLIPYLDGATSLKEAVQTIKQETHQYARRQRTWFKRDATINWVEGEALEVPLNQ